jgi:alanyl-tRNA synthetase
LDRQEHVRRVIKAEEVAFNLTLDRGLQLFEEIAGSAEESESPFITGEDAFKLYDTFGFPIDLTQVLARERGLEVDMPRFLELLQEQKDRSLRVHASKRQVIVVVDEHSDLESRFTGYDTIEDTGRVLAIEGNTIVLDRTPFYAESGGQIADTGTLTIDFVPYHVADVGKSGNAIIHFLEEEIVYAETGGIAHANVDSPRRKDIIRNHSATHLMHAALRKVLGDHVHQAGSLVTDDRLRFDFAHYQKVGAEELREIEASVNEKIREAIKLVHHRNIPFEEAQKMGALMFFGDKYGAKVNVVDFGPFSREFCGGIHVHSTSEIGLFKFIGESSIASGVRRVEAVTGKGVERFLLDQEEKTNELSREYDTLQEEKRKLEKEIAKLRVESRRDEMKALARGAKNVDGTNIRIVSEEIKVADAEELKSLGEMLREELKTASVATLGAALASDKVSLVSVVTDDLIKEKKLQAGKLVASIAEIVGGKGGGRPQIAQAGGKYPERLKEALASASGFVLQSIGMK